MPGSAAIETVGLSKTYGGNVPALVDLGLRVEIGEVFGYLGPNGAGKSTTIRLLMGSLRPTAGTAAVFGIDTWRRPVEAHRMLGYLPGDLRLAGRLSGDEQLASLARIRGGVDDRFRAELCERLGAVLDRPAHQLSKGNRQKLGVVQAFMHRPDLVILDEPTAGLDPLLQSEVRALIRETAADGRSVFLSSHSLDEVQHVADRVGIIRSGRLTDVDSVERLRERSLRHVTITFATQVDAAPFAALEGVRIVNADGPTLRLTAPERAMDALVKAASAHSITDLVSQPADLEDIFLELYREPDASI